MALIYFYLKEFLRTYHVPVVEGKLINDLCTEDVQGPDLTERGQVQTDKLLTRRSQLTRVVDRRKLQHLAYVTQGH